MAAPVQPRTVDVPEGPTGLTGPPPAGPTGPTGPDGREATPRPEPMRPRKRRVTSRTPTERLITLGCAANSFLLVWLLYARLTGGVGWLGFLITWYLLFVLFQYVTTREMAGPVAAADRVAAVVIGSATAALMVPFVWMIGYIVVRGIGAL